MSHLSPTSTDPLPSMSDQSPTTTNMEDDEGKGVKRKNDDSAALLPTQETQDSTNKQEEQQDDGDVQMQDFAVALPNKVDNDQDNMESIKEIIEKILAEPSYPRFLTKWKDLDTGGKAMLLELVMDACKEFTNKQTFEADLKVSFRTVFQGDKQILAMFVAGVYAECMKQGLIVESKDFSTRVVTITHGLSQDFLGTFDLTVFQKHIDRVFKWHEGGHTKFLGPSFAIVQSSGMGKTKLMREYSLAVNQDKNSDTECKKSDIECMESDTECKKSDIQCMMILCMGNMQEEPPDFETYYQAKLRVQGGETATAEGANDIMLQLGKIEKTCKKKKVIFFFDEAQLLLPGSSVGLYHTVLWWLRQVRKKSFVGVFAGTLLGLSKFQVVNARSDFSRDDKQSYKNYDPNKPTPNLLLYAPFYSLTTISISRSHKIKDDTQDELKDIRKYGCNGRPLFAAMLRRQGSAASPALTLSNQNFVDGITDPTMYSILRRLMLSPNENEPWHSQSNSIAAVLGTRVQLGLANYDFVNKATSSGYAMLVRTPDYDHHDQWMKFGSVAIVFPPDPVCAALAMGLMQPGWILRKNDVAEIQGKEPTFWVSKMADLFDQHFCLPSRGDCGEVFAALYMLLCGDALRYKGDQYMRLFDVELGEWLGELKETPGNREGPMGPDTSMVQEKAEVRRSRRLKAANDMTQETISTDMEKVQESMTSLFSTDSKLYLNFIQVCRNYFRSHAWFDQSMLEYMYDTATGCYVYPLCPAIDIVFPIKKVDQQQTISYHPCLVSVKCWDSITFSDMRNAQDSMENYLKDYREDESRTALCLLIVIGTSRPPRNLPEDKGTFPREDSFMSIVVPSSDKFGVNTTIQNMAGASHISELLASHSFAYAEKHENALRTTATKKYRDIGEMLLEDKQRLWKAQKEETTPNSY